MKNNTSIEELIEKNKRQEYILNQMSIRCSVLEFENMRLRKRLLHCAQSQNIDTSIIMQYENNPIEFEQVVQILATPINYLYFRSNISECFKKLNIETIADLLIELKLNQMKNFKAYRGVGDSAIREIFLYLQNIGVFDQYNYSYLYNYI